MIGLSLHSFFMGRVLAPRAPLEAPRWNFRAASPFEVPRGLSAPSIRTGRDVFSTARWAQIFQRFQALIAGAGAPDAEEKIIRRFPDGLGLFISQEGRKIQVKT